MAYYRKGLYLAHSTYKLWTSGFTPHVCPETQTHGARLFLGRGKGNGRTSQWFLKLLLTYKDGKNVVLRDATIEGLGVPNRKTQLSESLHNSRISRNNRVYECGNEKVKLESKYCIFLAARNELTLPA